eukprot:INCI16494.2.p1 GENE.INCI16494.2~~INCI16494.2.p1  ORF type:complete len:150 (-),score=39.33 INCI16494.2:76-525(-)
MQFLDQKKRSVVVNGERVWEDDPRYRELTKKEKKEKPEADAADKEEEEEEEAWREEQWKEDSAIIKSWFTPKLFAKVAAWIALFYYLGPNARPAFVFATFFALIFLNRFNNFETGNNSSDKDGHGLLLRLRVVDQWETVEKKVKLISIR